MKYFLNSKFKKKFSLVGVWKKDKKKTKLEAQRPAGRISFRVISGGIRKLFESLTKPQGLESHLL